VLGRTSFTFPPYALVVRFLQSVRRHDVEETLFLDQVSLGPSVSSRTYGLEPYILHTEILFEGILLIGAHLTGLAR
jgi:hypothetical protein